MSSSFTGSRNTRSCQNARHAGRLKGTCDSVVRQQPRVRYLVGRVAGTAACTPAVGASQVSRAVVARCARAPGRRSCGCRIATSQLQRRRAAARSWRGRSSPPRRHRAPGLRPAPGRAGGAARSAPGSPRCSARVDQAVQRRWRWRLAVGWWRVRRHAWRAGSLRDDRWRGTVASRPSHDAHRTSQPDNIDVRHAPQRGDSSAWKPPWRATDPRCRRPGRHPRPDRPQPAPTPDYDGARPVADGQPRAGQPGRAQRADLLILDLMMPGLDGLEVSQSAARPGRATADPDADRQVHRALTACSASSSAPTTT